MNPKVSVIIPTYKRSNYLARAIDSVLNQTYEDIEVVVVDDNDEDSKYRLATEVTMKMYTNSKNIIYIKNKENFGGAVARNIGIDHATGEYITFLDDDDIYLPVKVENQINFMMIDDHDMTFTDVRIHDENNRLVDYRTHTHITDFSNKELLKQHIMHHLTPTATYMIKKDKFLLIGGFEDVEVGQEFYLMLKAIEQNLRIAYLPEANLIQYLHEGERISVGENKLRKEVELYNFKKTYAGIFTNKEKRYIKFRHNAVMAIVSKRSGNKVSMVKYIFKTVFVSPLNCISELVNQINKIQKNRKK